MLGALLEETRGVVGVVLGTADGELRAVVGSVADGNTGAAVTASLTEALSYIGTLLGLGELEVASIKGTTAARVVARQAGAVVAIELDAKRPLGDLETKLRTQAWAPPQEDIPEELPEELTEEVMERPAVNRAPTVPLHQRQSQAMMAASAPPSPSRPSSSVPVPLPPPKEMSRAGRATPPPAPLGGPYAATPRGTPSPTTPSNVPSEMKQVGSGPVFTGDLEEFALPDLLEFLRNSHRTGLLMCTTASGVGTVQLSRGMIIGADSPNALDLREHFLTSADVAPDRRRALAALPPESFGDDMIDGVLGDMMPRDDVERARVARIYSAFREMMAWTSGRFSFDPAVPVAANPALALSAQSILMQIFQEQDEQGR
jgi:predicted regulator of Ras-like GTPase activity (Roadblock/LC7/MglB family)